MAATFKTPVLGNTCEADFDRVYEPAEDSFLMLDMLEQDHTFLQTRQPFLCLEVGCGSGICITFLAQILGGEVACFCTDINPKATEMARATATKNGQNVEAVVCNLTDPLDARLQGQVDVLLFNPPYVVTPSEEVGSTGIEASWAGGIKGREVTDKFLPRVSSLLSAKGVFYLVAIKENDPAAIEQMMQSFGLSMTCLGTRRAGRELLSILRFSREKQTTEPS